MEKRKPNSQVAHFIASWANNFDCVSHKIKSSKDLSNGKTFVDLVKIILINLYDESYQHADLSDINDRYGLLRIVFETNFYLTSGINFDLAKNGNEFELCKIALVILINGASKDIKEFIDASDKLDETSYAVLQSFYSLCESQKLNVPPKTAKIYDDFLVSSNHTRRSISKEFNSSSSGASSSGPSSATVSRSFSITSAANFLLSPLSKATLNSPRDKHRRKTEEDHHNEKKQLERALHAKEMAIEDLTATNNENLEKINNLEARINEYSRRITEFNSYKEKIEDYENMQDRLKTAEKELTYFKEKVRELSMNLEELMQLRESNARQTSQISQLSNDLETIEKKNKEYFAEMKRLQRIEKDNNLIKLKLESTEKEVLSLIEQKTTLHSELTSLKTANTQLKMDYEEQIEELNGQNAFLNNQISVMQANNANLTEEITTTRADLDKTSAENTNLNANLKECETELKQVAHVKENLLVENFKMQKEIDCLKENLELKESKLNACSTELKSTSNELNSKIKANEQTIDELNKQNKHISTKLNSTIAEYQEFQAQAVAEKTSLVDKLNKTLSDFTSLDTEHKKLKFASELEIGNLNRTIESLREANKLIESTNDDLKSQLATYANQITQYKLDIFKLEETNGELTRELNKKNTLIKDLEQAKQACVEENEKLNAKLFSVNQTLELSECQIKSLKSEIEQMQEEQTNERKSHEKQLDELKSQIEMKTNDYSSLEKFLNDLRQDRIEEEKQYELEMDAAKQEIQSLEKLKQKYEDEISEHMKEIGQNKEVIADLNRVVTSQADNILQLEARIERETNKHLEDKQMYEQTVEVLHSQLSAKQDEVCKLESSLAEESKSYKLRLDEFKAEYCLKEQELLKVQQKIEQMKQYHLNEINDAKQNLEQYIENYNSLVAELNSVKNEFQANQAEIESKNEKISNLTSLLSEAKTQIETKEEHLSQLNNDLVSYRSEIDSKVSEITSLEEQIRELKAELTSSRELISKLETDLKTQVDACEEKTSRIDSLQNELSLSKQESHTHSTDLAQTKTELNQCLNDLASTRAELEVNLTNLAQIKSELSSKMNEYDTTKRELSSNLDALNQEYSNLKKIFDDAKQKYENDLNELNVKYNEQIDLKQKEIDSLIATNNENTHKFTNEINKKQDEYNNLIKAKSEEIESLKASFQQVESKYSQELTSSTQRVCQLEGQLLEKDSQFKSVETFIQQANNERKTYMEKYTQLESDSNNKIVEINNLKIQLQEKNTHVQRMEFNYRKIETEYLTLKQSFTACNESLEIKVKELTAKVNEYEQMFAQKTNELAALKSTNHQLTKNMTIVAENSTNITNQLEYEKKQNEQIQKRLKDDLVLKQADLETLKSKVKLAEEKVDDLNKKLDQANKLHEQDNVSLEQLKQINTNLAQTINDKNKEIDDKNKQMVDMESHLNSIKDYANKLDEHYQKKKVEFGQVEVVNKDLRFKMSQLENELIRLREENRFQTEKIKTIQYEKDQLKYQKEEMTRKLNEMPARYVDSMDTISQKNRVLSTPKSKFCDDQCVKYSSPELRTSHTMQNLMQDDISRRFSIDSTNFKNSNSNLANSSVNACSIAGGFNRFNAISENEFEEPSVNQKFLQLQENPMNAMKRLSSLQDRNNRVQPHLRSSYALENLPADENQIKGSFHESKENRISFINSKTAKRHHDDTNEANSPPKKTYFQTSNI